MGRGRPRKSTGQRAQEGNPGKRPIPPDLPLDGVPAPTLTLTDEGLAHFMRITGGLAAVGAVKRIDSDGLTLVAVLFERIVLAKENGEDDRLVKLIARWQSLAAQHHVLPTERVKLMAAIQKPDANPVRAKYQHQPIRLAQ